MKRSFYSSRSFLATLSATILLAGCSSPTSDAPLTDRELSGLKGPVKSVLMAIPDTDLSGAAEESTRPAYYTEYTEGGMIVKFIQFGVATWDTSSFVMHTYNDRNLRIETVKRKGGVQGGLERTRYFYDSTGRLIRQEIRSADSQSVPDYLFLYLPFAGRAADPGWIDRNIDHPLVAVFYRNDKGIDVAHEWIIDGESKGLVRYLIDTVILAEERLQSVHVPTEYLENCEADNHIMYFDMRGRKRMDWMFRNSPTLDSGLYDCLDMALLRQISLYDEQGRLKAGFRTDFPQLSPPFHYTQSRFGDAGEPVQISRVTGSSIESILEGEGEETTSFGDREYRDYDAQGNWQVMKVGLADIESAFVVYRRTIDYYENPE